MPPLNSACAARPKGEKHPRNVTGWRSLLGVALPLDARSAHPVPQKLTSTQGWGRCDKRGEEVYYSAGVLTNALENSGGR